MENQPVLKKILLDFSEYERLKHIESEYLKLQHSNSFQGQIGKGVDEIDPLINASNQSGFGLTNESGTESSSSSIVPAAATLEPKIKEYPPTNFDVKLVKDDLNDVFDEQKLLALVPNSHKKSAKILLTQFDKRGEELTWNSTGTIFINQISIPGSNIYVLFPLLFKKQYKKIQGFDEFVQKINDMGLNDLIVVKAKYKSYEPNDIVKQTLIGGANAKSDSIAVPWWYIGD